MAPDARRAARLAVVMDHSTPAHFLRAWDFYCNYYLRPQNTRFFFKFKPFAPMHYCAVYDLGRYPYNALAFPRGAGKSTVLVKSIPTFLAYTRPGMTITLVTSTDRRHADIIDAVRMQIVNNDYLRGDFGDLKPKRGEGIWKSSKIRLANGFKLEGVSITGKNLGDRPQLLILDDVEHDPDNPESGPKLTEQLELKLFDTYMPMMQEGTTLFWDGTIRPRRSTMLARILRSKHPQFAYWNRRAVSIYDPKADETRTCWREKWPPSVIRGLKKKLQNAFYSEYMNMPMSIGTRMFKFDPKYHTYLVTRRDPLLDTSPLESRSNLSFLLRPPSTDSRREPTVVTQVAGPLFSSMFRFMTVDFAKTVSAKSDFQCCSVLGMDSAMRLWLLDLWSERRSRDVLIQKVIELAIKWRVSTIGAEAVSVQQELVDILYKSLEEQCLSTIGTVPRVLPLKGKAYMVDKGERISTIGWRFDRDTILLPSDQLAIWPVSQLVEQIRNFNGVAEDLAHDDALDTLAMSTQVLHLRRGPSPETRVERSRFQAFLDDPTRQALGVPATSGFDASQLSDTDLAALRAHHDSRARQLGGSSIRTSYADEESGDAILERARTQLRRVGAGWVADLKPIEPGDDV